MTTISILHQQNRIKGSLGLLLMLLLTLGGCLFGQPYSVYAQSGSDADRVAFNKDLAVNKGEVVNGNVSVTNGRLAMSGEVKGKVTVVSGDTDIEGTVRGDVVVTNGNLELGAGSVVEGNVLVVAGEMTRLPGAVVKGNASVVESPLGSGNQVASNRPDGPPFHVESQMFIGSVSRFVGVFSRGIVSLLVLLLIAGMSVVLSRRARIAGDTLVAEPGPSLAVGVVLSLLLGPVVGVLTFALVISIVGIVLVPVLAVVVALSLLFGMLVVGVWLGRRVYESTHQGSLYHEPPLIVEALLGTSVVLACTIVPSVFLPGWITFLMAMLVYFVACVGLGSVLLSRFGTLAPTRRASRFAGPRVDLQEASQPAVTAPLGPAPTLPEKPQS